MGTQITSIDDSKVITFAAGEDFIHTQISLAPGATDYRALSALEKFPVFAVRFDTNVGDPTPADGASIVWHTQLTASKGNWWNVIVVENKSTVPVSVVVKTKNV